MKRRSIISFIGACIITSTTALAVTSQTEENGANLHQQIRSLNAQTRQLSTKVKSLDSQLETLQNKEAEHQVLEQEIEQNKMGITTNKTAISRNRIEILRTEKIEERFHAGMPPPGHPSGPVPPGKLQTSTYTLGSTVTTSPYLGIRSAFDASDLLTSLPSMNEDLRLLRQRATLEDRLKELGEVPIYANRPLLELGGQLAAQGVYMKPYQGASTNTIDLTTAELDVLAIVSEWAQGFMSLQYDNSLPTLSNNPVPGNRISNSRIFLTRGFITIGDLAKFPIYLTAGQMYVPFGEYASYMITDPLTKTLGRTNQRAAVLGFFRNGFYAQGYAFKGASNIGAPGIDQGGLNAGYQYSGSKLTANLGAGYILNIADSLGMQGTGVGPNAGFQGFGVPPGGTPNVVSTSSANEYLFHRVPAVDVHGSATYGPFTLIGEYVGATRDFSPQNLTFNFDGAQPKAMQAEGVFAFNAWERPTNIALAYNQSWEALALNIPEHSMIGVANISIWKDTVESLEYRHDWNYSASDTSSGNGAPIPVYSAGGSQNTVTLQLAIYF